MTTSSALVTQPASSISSPQSPSSSYESRLISSFDKMAAIVDKLMAGINFAELDPIKKFNVVHKFVNSYNRALIQLYTVNLKYKKQSQELDEDDIIAAIDNMVKALHLEKFSSSAEPSSTLPENSAEFLEQIDSPVTTPSPSSAEDSPSLSSTEVPSSPNTGSTLLDTSLHKLPVDLAQSSAHHQLSQSPEALLTDFLVMTRGGFADITKQIQPEKMSKSLLFKDQKDQKGNRKQRRKAQQG